MRNAWNNVRLTRNFLFDAAPFNPGLSVVGSVGPHAQGGFFYEIGVAVTEGGIEAAAVALGDVAHGRILLVRAVVKEGGAEAGIIPRVHLLQAPDLEDVGAAITDGDGAAGVLDLSHGTAGIVPVVDE